MFTLYMHKNKINNKVYIGQTIQDPQERWKNGKGYGNCTRFNRAIQKYGWENFEHIILEQFEGTQEYANERENYYIELYDSRDPEKGYNINAGGYQTISPKALPAALLWMKKHPEFGLARAKEMHKWQEEHPDEFLKNNQINVQKAIQKRKKPVRCIETNEVFESATDAARKVPGTTQSKICMACRGQRNTCGGFHWCYIDEGK